MKVNAIIQARCGSTRFPNKVFADIDGEPLIWHVVNRLSYTKKIDEIIIATTVNEKDDKIEKWCSNNDIGCYRGDENDVLNRYYCASQEFPSDIIVRITADDPFKEPDVIDRVINKLIDGQYDYVTNNYPPSFPEGLDCEAFTWETLKKMENLATEDFEREHVTQYIFKHLEDFQTANVSSKKMLKDYRWTIDTRQDYEMVREIYAKRDMNKNGILLMEEILDILNKNPKILEINSSVHRSLMYQ